MPHIVLIQESFDNEAKFNLAVTHDVELHPDAILWIAQVYTAKHNGRRPDVYRSVYLDNPDWNNLIIFPSENVIEFEGSDYWPSQENRKMARMAIKAHKLFFDEMRKQEQIIKSYVRHEMLKDYGIETTGMRLPSMVSSSTELDTLIHLVKGTK